ncbi:hypothetical protein BD414DRAFT_575691 [Trametes punicea]|nr:hypothetical protein BD414DRAFT_575691 [Trametes punicea]
MYAALTIFALAFLGRAVQASSLALGGLTDAAASYPAALILCPTASCISCYPLDMSIIPPNTCLAEQLPKIESQIPSVNTCFNIDLAVTATDVAIN